MTYWHYTCDHGRRGIGATGLLIPLEAQLPSLVPRDATARLMFSLIWLTDLPEPDIPGLGLTSHNLNCERWTHRYRVTDDTGIAPFARIQHLFPAPAQVRLLRDGARPEHWFVAFRRIPVVYDPVKVTA